MMKEYTEPAFDRLTGRPTTPATFPGSLAPEAPLEPSSLYEYLDDGYGEVAAVWYTKEDEQRYLENEAVQTEDLSEELGPEQEYATQQEIECEPESELQPEECPETLPEADVSDRLAGRPTIPATFPGNVAPEAALEPSAQYEYLDDDHGELSAVWYEKNSSAQQQLFQEEQQTEVVFEQQSDFEKEEQEKKEGTVWDNMSQPLAVAMLDQREEALQNEQETYQTEDSTQQTAYEPEKVFSTDYGAEEKQSTEVAGLSGWTRSSGYTAKERSFLNKNDRTLHQPAGSTEKWRLWQKG